ncbi:multidrug effflux MFS transporter [Vibrio sp. OPT18]|uniref:multidrug effflux MFS transporter n=1 Tax=Vibrio sp. OPT18 TaxID=2778641 RepID=UPI00187DFABB|nr:multidrug effflux MFS transporter [Vibrio sp. OPT18]MBE8575279.1 multidrug effflux MFS transporter [Vibrio sp. OPT18]
MFKKDNRLLLYLFMLVILWPLAIDIYLPAFPNMAQEMTATPVDLKKTVTYFMIGFGIGQLILGVLTDRWGRKNIAIWGVAFYLTCSMLQSAVGNVDDLIMLRLIQGISSAATSVAVMAMVRDSYKDKDMPKLLSYLNGAVCCVPALAPVLGGYLTQTLGWRSNFGFMALYALVVLLCISIGLPETRTERQPNTANIPYSRMILNPQFIFHSIICMLAMSAILAYVSNAPVWLMVHLNLDVSQFSFWFTANAVINALASFIVAPLLINMFSVRRVLKVGLCVVVCGGLLMLFATPSPTGFMVPIFINSIGFSIVLGTASSKALNSFETSAGAASALLGFIQMAGAGLVVLMVQLLTLEVPDLIALHMLLLAPAIIILMGKRGRRLHPQSNFG